MLPIVQVKINEYEVKFIKLKKYTLEINDIICWFYELVGIVSVGVGCNSTINGNSTTPTRLKMYTLTDLLKLN